MNLDMPSWPYQWQSIHLKMLRSPFASPTSCKPNQNDILLDSQSQDHIFQNHELLGDVINMSEVVTVHGQVSGADFSTNQAGSFLSLKKRFMSQIKPQRIFYHCHKFRRNAEVSPEGMQRLPFLMSLFSFFETSMIYTSLVTSLHRTPIMPDCPFSPSPIVKERMRTIMFSIPNSLLPYLVTFVTRTFNMVATTNSENQLSPFENFLGRRINYDIDLRIYFGMYCQVLVANTSNSFDQRTTGAVALTQTNSTNGAALFHDLNTKKVINRDKWTKLNIPQEAIDRINAGQDSAHQEPLYHYGIRDEKRRRNPC
jgi:hypothetical protein